jgi:Flp pilus assembly protein TadG
VAGREFAGDRRGSVGLVFALTAFVVLSLVGGAIDFGRAMTARDQLQNAVDASALAAARAWQTESDIGVAQDKGLQFFNANKPHGYTATMSLEPDYARNSLVMQATAQVPAPFLTAANSIVRPLGATVDFEYLPIHARAEAMLAVGGSGESNLEIAMMLDVTGSMAGSKIDDLKAAAKDLIDIVVWDDQSEYTSRVALVPFANGVHLGSTTLVDQVRGALRTGSCTSSTSPCTSWSWGSPAAYYRFANTSGSNSTFRPSSYCVSERVGADMLTDEAPNTAARRMGPIYQSSNSSEQSRCSLVRTTDLTVNTIMPLSNEKAILKGHIDKMQTGGATAGQIGTAWAWYMLSPKWAYLWPSQNRPVAYGTEKTQKIAILMSDGEYNTAHANGVLSRNSANNGTRINTNATNGISDTQADQMCAAMKNNTGITVYTVGFALGGNATAISTLRNCASDPSKFYEAEDGDALKQAFRDIALQVAKLRLSQ